MDIHLEFMNSMFISACFVGVTLPFMFHTHLEKLLSCKGASKAFLADGRSLRQVLLESN